jgi:hypothetical protein
LGRRCPPALAFAILMLEGEAAQSDCTPQPASNITAACTGTITNQGGGLPGTSADTNGYRTGTQTGITVDVAGRSRHHGDRQQFRYLYRQRDGDQQCRREDHGRVCRN